MGAFDELGTLTEAQHARRASQKGPSRLEQVMESRPLTRIDEKAFKAAVIARDGNICRCCGRKVVATIALVPERREVHHIHGRTGDLRFEVRAAIVSCLLCHKKFTGKVGEHKVLIIPTKTFTTRQGTFCDATFPIVFREAR